MSWISVEEGIIGGLLGGKITPEQALQQNQALGDAIFKGLPKPVQAAITTTNAQLAQDTAAVVQTASGLMGPALATGAKAAELALDGVITAGLVSTGAGAVAPALTLGTNDLIDGWVNTLTVAIQSRAAQYKAQLAAAGAAAPAK